MKSIILPPNEFLDHYVLNTEFHQFANISKNAYKFWKKASEPGGGQETVSAP